MGRAAPPLKKLVGVAAGIGAIAISLINLFVLVVFENRGIGGALLDIKFLFLFVIGLIWTATIAMPTKVAVWGQVSVFFIATLATAISSNPGNATSALFLIYTLVLLVEYKVPRKLLYGAVAVVTVSFIVSLSVGYRSYTPGWVPVTINTLVLVTLFVVLYGGVLARHWIQHRREAELLESRVRERTADLEKALDERVVMLQEIHHRVKNNLQIIASLLRLETNRLAEDDAARRPMETSIQRIHAMSLVHETLYQSEGFRLVELRGYTRELLSAISGAIEASLHYDTPTDTAIEVSLDFAIPFGLLLNELVSNAAEHAYAPGEKGRIEISLSCNDDVELVVEDDGVGLDSHEETNGSQSLGLTLVRSLVKQLNGRISLESSSGTRWHAIFPLEQARTPVSPPKR